MLDHLKWNSLETRINIAKVTMQCKIINNLVAINPDFYISSQISLTRHSHSLRVATRTQKRSCVHIENFDKNENMVNLGHKVE